MANFGWLTLDRDSGNQNKEVQVTATPHTGRIQREKTLYIRTTYGSPAATASVTFTQAGKQEFVDFNDSSATAMKSSSSLTLSGTSNSSKIVFSLEDPTTGEKLPLTLPQSYLANSTNTSINQAITGDPGQSNQFGFSIVLTIPANPKPDARSITIRANANDNVNITDTCTITQIAADPTLSVSPVSITLDTSGTAQTFTVTSNTNWEISATANN